MTDDDWDEAPEATGPPDEVRTSNPDGGRIDQPEPEDDPAVEHVAPLEGDHG